MSEELHWQPMASRDLGLDREQPPHLRISGPRRRPRDRRPKTAWPWV